MVFTQLKVTDEETVAGVMKETGAGEVEEEGVTKTN